MTLAIVWSSKSAIYYGVRTSRHTALFAKRFAAFDLTPLQFALLMKLAEHPAGLSQNPPRAVDSDGP